jgi:hypothetical protein
MNFYPRLSGLIVCVSFGFFLSGCTSYVPPGPLGAAKSSYSESGAPPSSSRPGLATQLGHEMTDRSRATPFFRKSASHPDAVASFHYNDERGASAMAELRGSSGRKRSGSVALAEGRVRACLTSDYGRTSLPSVMAGNKVVFIGTPDDDYRIRLENPGSKRLEVIVSVDGMDTRTGQSAGFAQRGYVIEPRSEIVVSGIKVNGKLRSLKFGSVADSHAAAKSSARNVGVIGVAIFEEDVVAAKQAAEAESSVREDASAFSL